MTRADRDKATGTTAAPGKAKVDTASLEFLFRAAYCRIKTHIGGNHDRIIITSVKLRDFMVKPAESPISMQGRMSDVRNIGTRLGREDLNL
jgi:hypothetical protein